LIHPRHTVAVAGFCRAEMVFARRYGATKKKDALWLRNAATNLAANRLRQYVEHPEERKLYA
jgi:hypothetical protein